jgi:flagellar assembly protein FliH
MMRALRLPDLAAPPPSPAAPPPDPVLLDAAREEGAAAGFKRGYDEGLAEGLARQRAAQEEMAARALAAIAAAMPEAAEAGRRAAEEAAEALATTLFAAMDAALPGAAARVGADLVPHVLLPLLPALADRPEAVLRVAPALAGAVAARLPPGALAIVPDAAVAPGDALVEWRDGAWIVSLEERRAAVRQALRAAGFVLAEGEGG